MSKHLVLMLILAPFFTFSQSDSIPHLPKIKLASCEEVPCPPLTKAYKDSIFNLHKIKIVDIEENEVDEVIVEDYSMKDDPKIILASYPSGELEMFKFAKNGNISNIKIVKGISTCVDNSVIEMIKKMPKWTPAEFEGQLLDSTFELPIQLEFR